LLLLLLLLMMSRLVYVRASMFRGDNSRSIHRQVNVGG